VVSQHLLGDWCDRCGLLVPASDIVDGICRDCRDDCPSNAPLELTDAEIDRALDRMDELFGPGWLRE
jgi:hypothetical protein